MNVNIQILEVYYTMWLDGKDLADIRTAIMTKFKISDTTFDRYTPYFLHYCRDRVKKDCRNPEVKHIQLTQAREKEFIEYVQAGLSYDKAAKIMGIPLATVLDEWFSNEIFKTLVEVATEKANAEVVKALHRRAIGFKDRLSTVTEQKAIKVDEETGEETETVVNRTESFRTVQVLPSVEAIKMWLYNRDPENWAPNGENVDKGAKSQILEAIEQLAEMDDEERKELEEQGLECD